MKPTRTWTRAAAVMATALALFITVSALRALLVPQAFARTFGLPLYDPHDARLLGLYALRTLFLAAFTLTLVWRERWRTLATFAALALVLPLGDALLVVGHTGSLAGTARHVVIGSYLLATALVARRAAAHAPVVEAA